jgi:nicotinamide-nucleotide amidase
LNDTETLSPLLPNETEEAARRLLSKAAERHLKLATAESCTGGMLASLLTDVQGVAHTFDRGFVTYSYDAKHEMLGVPWKLIEENNAVTPEGGDRDGGRGSRAIAGQCRAGDHGFADAGWSPASSTSPARGRGGRPRTGRSISAPAGAARRGSSA